MFWLIQKLVQNLKLRYRLGLDRYPVPRSDGQWLASCSHCEEFTLFASRGGYYNGGIEHCYTCGQERITQNVREEDIKRNIISAWAHWQHYPIIPYNWHLLSEAEKYKILFSKAE